MWVAEYNYHTIFPIGKKELATHEWKLTVTACHLIEHLKETWMEAGTLVPAKIRKEQKCPQDILHVGTSQPTVRVRTKTERRE